MILRFKLGDYEEMCDENEEAFENEDTVDVSDGENLLVTRTRRIVIPELHASFREADWYALNEDVDDPDDPDAWECQNSVWVHYEEHETDPDKFVSYATCDLAFFAGELMGEKGKDYEVVAQLECFIDTAEFDEEE